MIDRGHINIMYCVNPINPMQLGMRVKGRCWDRSAYHSSLQDPAYCHFDCL